MVFFSTRLPKNGLAGGPAGIEASFAMAEGRGELTADILSDGVLEMEAKAGIGTAAGGGVAATMAGVIAGVKGAAAAAAATLPPGVKAAALGLNGLNELAFALNLKFDLLAAVAAVFEDASLCLARSFSGSKGGILGIVILAKSAFVDSNLALESVVFVWGTALAGAA